MKHRPNIIISAGRRLEYFKDTITSFAYYNYLEDYYDDNVYFNNPMMYMSNLNDDYHLPRLQKADSIVIATGQGAFEAPDRSRDMSRILDSKGIPHVLDVWGHDVRHDWEWWRKMLPHFLSRFLS